MTGYEYAKRGLMIKKTQALRKKLRDIGKIIQELEELGYEPWIQTITDANGRIIGLKTEKRVEV